MPKTTIPNNTDHKMDQKRAAFAWTLLLIDDETDIREVMTVALEDKGYGVLPAPDGEAGVALCKTARPQIVITDVRMPKMNGIEVLKAIKQFDPSIEVIVMTAFGDMDLAIQALQHDASDFITKPIHDDALALALKRARSRYRSRQQLCDYTALLEKERAHTARELEHNIAFQRNLIESSMDGIVGCDAQERIVIFNRAMEQLTGRAKDSVINIMKLGQFFPPDEHQQFKDRLCSDKYGGASRLFLYETRLLAVDGQTIPVQVSAAVLMNGAEKNGLVCLFRDLRQLHLLEREVADQARIMHQDKMMSLGKLAASVVHEINNPLSGILNYSRLMKRILGRDALGPAQVEKFQRYLALMESETDRCSKIVSGLLTFSRKSPVAFGQVDIAELMQRCILLSQHKLELSDIRLTSRIESGLPLVKGDFNQLQQCVINLIFNAIDAMPDGGELRLTAAPDPREAAVLITVKDTGSGIAEGHLPHLFEPFFTTKKEGFGTGLGLSTVYGIMERHHGSVTVFSRKGEGASFTLHLPFSP